MIDHRRQLAKVKRFDQLVAYLRDEMDWPIARDSFEDVGDLFFDFTADELGIDPKTAAKIEEIKRLRPLSVNQPWGIFFIKFEPKRLPVVALRRILSHVALKRRASANSAERTAWTVDDLLFVSNYGEGDDREITFAHFSQPDTKHDLPTLKVLGWDNLDTALHLDDVAEHLTRNLSWPDDESDIQAWREQWSSAFTLRHGEIVTTSKDLSVRLAELARAIRDRIKSALAIETETGPLTTLMSAFQEALVHDLDADGFADMYAQTITYGLLSARIANPHKKTADDFAGQMRTNPFLRELMETFLEVGGRRGKAGSPGIDFDELGVSDVVQLLDDANMEAVVLDFGDRNPQEDPVIHFYELFLKEYDAKKRMQRGVFYTPRPVVSYIVRSADEILRTEFGLVDGLADTTTWREIATRHKNLKIPESVSADDAFVQILDPATGTGTFLVEVIELIHTTLVLKWQSQGHSNEAIEKLWNEYVAKHLLTRLHGYELLMAPYAIAHLKIGLKLYETGYRFDNDQRARIYLTNALEPATDADQLVLEGVLPALAHEAEAVNEIKRNRRFTVVIGNPPYAGHSSNNQVAWIVDKVYDYKRGFQDLQKPGQAKWLQDDYVKFLRLAEWQIARTDCGLVGFITNHAWLDNPTFKGMRSHFLETFDRRVVLDLHGNANKKEVTLDGFVDQNVFEIKQGVAISLLVRNTDSHAVRPEEGAFVERSDLRGTDGYKLDELSRATLGSLASFGFEALAPEYLFLPIDRDLKAEYEQFVPIPAIMNRNGDPAPGIVTTQDEFAISFSPAEQITKVNAFLATRNEAEARELFRLCSQSQWNYSNAMKALRVAPWQDEIVPLLYRPFDRRVTVYNKHVAVHLRSRVSRFMLNGGNVGLSIPRSTEIKRGWEHALCTSWLIQHHTVSLKEVNYLFPLWLDADDLNAEDDANISPECVTAVREVTGLEWSRRTFSKLGERGCGDLKTTFGPRDVFDFVYAILHSPSYRSRYADFLKSDFARIPLTSSAGLFSTLVPLGRELVALHLMTSPKLERAVARYAGPSSPEVGQVRWLDDAVWLDAASAKTGRRATPGTNAGFRGVSEDVWNFHIGGYRICEKWLKDRKGRVLSHGDIAHYEKIVVALSETIRLMAEIDEVIDKHGGWPDAFVVDATMAAG